MSKQEQTKKSSLEGVICSDPGTPIAPVYKRVFDKELGRNVVQIVDETNIQEFIQASASLTDLAALEKRFIATGEIPCADPSMNADGMDFTQMPANIHEVYAIINDIDNNFSKLPKSIQEIFGTREAYFKSVVDGTYQATLLKAISDSQKVPADTENKEGEK